MWLDIVVKLLASTVNQIVWGHVSEKSVPWAFHEHFSFFAETYSLNGVLNYIKKCIKMQSKHISTVLNLEGVERK